MSESDVKAKPVVPWPGGKARLLKFLMPLVPKHICYCEVFGGGLAMLLAKERSPLEVVNDIHGDLVRFYRVVKYHLETLLQELEYVTNSREDFKAYIDQPGLTDIQRAARWFMRRKNCFSDGDTSYGVGKLGGGSTFTSMQNKREAIRALALRLDKVSIESLDWKRLFKNYDGPETFFFCDPPYVGGEVRTYSPWTQAQVEEFAGAVRKLQGKWLVTLNDSEANRKLFTGYPQRRIKRVRGTVNKNPDQRKMYGELIIRSA